ncbi:hypothetical protein C1645_832193 [Glomus cerebriforme]|uniref:Uncharacterized protein n=1 Tax=Glomus cerebriforme TaxID=658196 RepID=A0A397SNQ8_9GLOM|nr:hypothetical protein C1645_832193 [Glomus cerebriforme]
MVILEKKLESLESNVELHEGQGIGDLGLKSILTEAHLCSKGETLEELIRLLNALAAKRSEAHLRAGRSNGPILFQIKVAELSQNEVILFELDVSSQPRPDLHDGEPMFRTEPTVKKVNSVLLEKDDEMMERRVIVSTSPTSNLEISDEEKLGEEL